jgi:hypothetical protein
MRLLVGGIVKASRSRVLSGCADSRQKPASVCFPKCLEAVLHPQLAVHIGQVKIDRPFADEQLIGYILGAFPLNDKGQDFDFPLGQFHIGLVGTATVGCVYTHWLLILFFSPRLAPPHNKNVGW